MLSDVDEVKGDRAAYHQWLHQWWDGRTREREDGKKPVKLLSLENQIKQNKYYKIKYGRKKRHRSNSNTKVYGIIIQLE